MFYLNTPEDISTALAARVRARRLALAWKQETLADRSGVSLASLRRFEKTGLISLQSLLKLAFAMDHLEDFEKLFQVPEARSLKDLELGDEGPKRGRL